jgi:hypothetical protein
MSPLPRTRPPFLLSLSTPVRAPRPARSQTHQTRSRRPEQARASANFRVAAGPPGLHPAGKDGLIDKANLKRGDFKFGRNVLKFW